MQKLHMSRIATDLLREFIGENFDFDVSSFVPLHDFVNEFQSLYTHRKIGLMQMRKLIDNLPWNGSQKPRLF